MKNKKKLSEMTLQELWQLFPIILAEYNPEYKVYYSEAKKSLLELIGQDNIERISHIGSTAVEGLLAKATVDILLEIKKDFEINKLKTLLKYNGWILMSEDNKEELNLVFNRGYTPEGFADKVFHLHIRFLADWDELYFRDYLRENKEIAEKYAELKKKLEKKYKYNRDAYTEAKGDFIKKWTGEARKEFGGRYLP